MSYGQDDEMAQQEINAQLRTLNAKFLSFESDLKRAKRNKEELDMEVHRLSKQIESTQSLIQEKLREAKTDETKIQFLEDQTYRLKKQMIGLRAQLRSLKQR